MILFLDACALIYRFEGASRFRLAATALIAELAAGQTVVELAVSRLSVLECRVKPLREGNAILLKRYNDFLPQCISSSSALPWLIWQLIYAFAITSKRPMRCRRLAPLPCKATRLL